MIESPNEVRTKKRRKVLNRIWQSKEWKAARLVFLAENPICRWCGKKADTPHHPIEDMYRNYLDLSKCIPFCRACHTASHKGLVLCPDCREHYMRRENPNGRCSKCMGTDWKEEQSKKKIQRNKKRRELQKASREKWKREHDRHKQD